uniref:Uncharacterized protein n=1 Tax=Ditylenchus dipsaci TaxID=166011 RepID=A0A915DZZ3_9BILA
MSSCHHNAGWYTGSCRKIYSFYTPPGTPPTYQHRLGPSPHIAGVRPFRTSLVRPTKLITEQVFYNVPCRYEI